MSSALESERRREVCRKLIAERKIVGAHLGFEACPVPTWDILLDLYLAHLEQRSTYLWSLCIAANIPMSSAHRKIGALVSEGLLERGADLDDGRRVTMRLAPETLLRLHHMIDEMAGLHSMPGLRPK